MNAFDQAILSDLPSLGEVVDSVVVGQFENRRGQVHVFGRRLRSDVTNRGRKMDQSPIKLTDYPNFHPFGGCGPRAKSPFAS